jgi:hypothetical protein
MNTTNPSTLVALLEKEYAWAVENSDQDLQETILAGLNWETHYWNDCALDWIDQGYPINQEVVEALESISSTKHKPQKTRHRAFAYAKRWQRKANT